VPHRAWTGQEQDGKVYMFDSDHFSSCLLDTLIDDTETTT
jgi:hypothetical protein